MTQSNEPAFPIPDIIGVMQGSLGLRKREYIAIKAMAAYIACGAQKDHSYESLARYSYEMADAMLAAG